MEKATMSETWTKLINELIEERGEDGGVMLQLTLMNGANAAGTLTKTKYEGMYRFVTMAKKEDGRGAQGMQPVDLYVPVDLVAMITVPTAEKDRPRIVPASGRIIG